MKPKKAAKTAKTIGAPATDKQSGLADIAETLRSLKTKFGEEAIMTLSDSRKVDIDAIASGSIGLDEALGIGGYPRGRIIEIYGPESSGKTTLSLHAIAEAQKSGGICAFIDAEHAMDPEYAKNLGVKLNELLISQPDNGEQALEIVESLVRSGKIDVIVIDSGVMFGNPETTPGGKALKFYTSVRLDIRRIAQIKKGEEVVGGRHRVKVVKNKVAAPFKATEFDLIYNEGISLEGELLALGEKYKYVTKSGSSYTFVPPGGLKITNTKSGATVPLFVCLELCEPGWCPSQYSRQ